MEKLLVVVKERALCRSLSSAFMEHYLFLKATNRIDAKRLFLKHLPKVVLLDLCLIPDHEAAGNGLSLEWVIGRHAATKVVVLAAHDDRSGAHQALCRGAYGFHRKPVVIDELLGMVQRAFHLCEVEEQRCQLKDTVELETAGIEGIAGQCAALHRLFSSSGGQAPRVSEALPEVVDGSVTLKEARDRVEKRMVSEAIGDSGGNMTRASLQLGVSRPALYGLMKKYGISKDAVRG